MPGMFPTQPHVAPSARFAPSKSPSRDPEPLVDLSMPGMYPWPVHPVDADTEMYNVQTPPGALHDVPMASAEGFERLYPHIPHCTLPNTMAASQSQDCTTSASDLGPASAEASGPLAFVFGGSTRAVIDVDSFNFASLSVSDSPALRKEPGPQSVLFNLGGPISGCSLTEDIEPPDTASSAFDHVMEDMERESGESDSPSDEMTSSTGKRRMLQQPDRHANSHKRPQLRLQPQRKALTKDKAKRKHRLDQRRIAQRWQRLKRQAPPQPWWTHDVFKGLPAETFTEGITWAQSAADVFMGRSYNAGQTPQAANARGSEPSPSSISQEEQAHQAALEESMWKLADLEKDRPLWDAVKQEHEERERAEAVARKVQHEADEMAKRAAEERVKCAAEERAAADAALDAQLERACIEELLYRSRLRQDAQWQPRDGPWTDARTFARYEALCAAFDKAKFSTDNPADFYEIPWPVLWAPISTSPVDVCWEAVEAFFATARLNITSANYRILVSQAHKRFHPDHWRARRILQSLDHEPLLQNCVANAVNLVSQAIMPIWQTVMK